MCIVISKRFLTPSIYKLTKNSIQVVGFFICKSEHSLGQATIQEALEVFKAWNPGYSPQFTMTDCDQAELNALRAVYPDIQTFLCDFHVKKAWKERLRNLFKDPTLNLGTFIATMIRP